MSSEELKKALLKESKAFEELYQWLQDSMSKIFFEEVPKEWISSIVHILMNFKDQGYFSEIHFKNAALVLAIDTPEADLEVLKKYPVYGIKNYTTYISRQPLPFKEKPVNLLIATIEFTEAFHKDTEHLPQENEIKLKALLKAKNPHLSEAQIAELINKMDIKFLRKMPLERQVLALELLERANSRDSCQYEVVYEEKWKEKDIPSVHVILSWKNVPKHNFLFRLARLIYQHHLVMRRVNAAYIDPYSPNGIFMLSFSLHGMDGNAAWEASDLLDFLQELVTLKYFGSFDLIDSTFIATRMIRGNLANLLRTMMNFVHQILVNVDPHLYSLENIQEGLCRHPELTVKLLDSFECKFHPQNHDINKFEELKRNFLLLVQEIDTGHELYDRRRKNILLQGMNFVEHTLKTNFYMNNKTALAFRLDPAYLDNAPFERKTIFPELPFGVFFIKGMHFIAFHVRFRDLSRGGLRTVFPQKHEGMLVERDSVFLECYNLAYTQHKKNKDIPEGGAKCVIFLKPNERLNLEAEILVRELFEAGIDKEEIDKKIAVFREEQKLEYLYETQRSFVKNFLKIINCDADGSLRAKNIVDYWKKPEYIYLGPDENMHNVMIEWIASESKKENYRPGRSFISGKPTMGINHKQYGVTSLTVNVYMHETLKYLGIDPEKQVFTVKMTGGPDGDVAGNQIYNLYRFYPKTAKLVALTDVSGTIFDPEGLDLEECVSLFKDGKSIRFYHPEKLSPGGFLLDRDSKKEISPYVSQTLCWRNKEGHLVADWLSGNEMNALYRHNVHQTPCDVFIPCGGRPRTLRESNIEEFLDKQGSVTAKAVVEGANLYFSPQARRVFEEKGCLIIKDSSANKGGVICSSFEILAGLTLTEEEFLHVKDELVKEILKRIARLAYQEGHLMLKTYGETKKYLTDISEEISNRINHFTDQLLTYLEKVTLKDDPNDRLTACFLAYCPKILRENYRAKLLSQVPDNHKKAIIASHIAAQLVYKRGLEWGPTIVEVLPLILTDDDLITISIL